MLKTLIWSLDAKPNRPLRILFCFEVHSLAGAHDEFDEIHVGTLYSFVAGAILNPRHPLFLECDKTTSPGAHLLGDAHAGARLRFSRDEYIARAGRVPGWVSLVLGSGEESGALRTYHDDEWVGYMCRKWPGAVHIVARSLLFRFTEVNGEIDEVEVLGVDERADCKHIRAARPSCAIASYDHDDEDIDFSSDAGGGHVGFASGSVDVGVSSCPGGLPAGKSF